MKMTDMTNLTLDMITTSSNKLTELYDNYQRSKKIYGEDDSITMLAAMRYAGAKEIMEILIDICYRQLPVNHSQFTNENSYLVGCKSK